MASNQLVLLGQSRYGEMAIKVRGRVVTVNNCHIRGMFIIPKQRPKYSSRLQQIPAEVFDMIVSFLPEVEQLHAKFFFSTLHFDDVPLYLDFMGQIRPEVEQNHDWVNHSVKQLNKELVPQHKTVTIDLEDGQVSIDSGEHLEFWLRFTLPLHLLPRNAQKRRFASLE